MQERLQKVLAQAGLGSRRQIEQWISAGRVVVDGKPAELGQKVSGRERISVDGRPVRIVVAGKVLPEVLIYHKPVGEVCSRDDPEGRDTVFAHLPKPHAGRWISVGRLDIKPQSADQLGAKFVETLLRLGSHQAAFLAEPGPEVENFTVILHGRIQVAESDVCP